MTSSDAEDPRPVIIGVGFVIVLLVGALFAVFQQRVNSSPAAAASREDRLEFAERLFRNGDNETAVKIFSELAGKDNGMAQYWLGHVTELGLGVPRDPSKAIELYKKAAAQDVAIAEFRLGEIYLSGDIVPPHFNQAKAYLEQAAYHGNARAAMQLSRMYHLGLGMPASPIEAYAWSEVASLEGNILARRERDASLYDLEESDQQHALARADEILRRITRDRPAEPTKPKIAMRSMHALIGGWAAR